MTTGRRCRSAISATAASIAYLWPRSPASGNHGESSRARRGRIVAVSPGQQPNRPQMIAASPADGSGSVLQAGQREVMTPNSVAEADWSTPRRTRGRSEHSVSQPADQDRPHDRNARLLRGAAKPCASPGLRAPDPDPFHPSEKRQPCHGIDPDDSAARVLRVTDLETGCPSTDFYAFAVLAAVAALEPSGPLRRHLLLFLTSRSAPRRSSRSGTRIPSR